MSLVVSLLLAMAADQPVVLTAEQAMNVYRDVTSTIELSHCVPAEDPTENDEIVVCGRRDRVNEAQRVSLSDEIAPSSNRPRAASGELNHDPGAPCRMGACGGIDVMKAAVMLGRLIGSVVDPGD